MAVPPPTSSLTTRFKLLFRGQSTSSQPTSQHQVQEPQPPEPKLPRPQSQSAFLSKLPFEIRQIIYTHVFGHSLIHILDMGRRLAHFRCPNKVWDWHRHGIEGLNGCPILNIEDHPNDELLALCKTCRIMYVCLSSITPIKSNPF